MPIHIYTHVFTHTHTHTPHHTISYITDTYNKQTNKYIIKSVLIQLANLSQTGGMALFPEYSTPKTHITSVTSFLGDPIPSFGLLYNHAAQMYIQEKHQYTCNRISYLKKNES